MLIIWKAEARIFVGISSLIHVASDMSDCWSWLPTVPATWNRNKKIKTTTIPAKIKSKSIANPLQFIRSWNCSKFWSYVSKLYALIDKRCMYRIISFHCALYITIYDKVEETVWPIKKQIQVHYCTFFNCNYDMMVPKVLQNFQIYII